MNAIASWMVGVRGGASTIGPGRKILSVNLESLLSRKFDGAALAAAYDKWYVMKSLLSLS